MNWRATIPVKTERGNGGHEIGRTAHVDLRVKEGV